MKRYKSCPLCGKSRCALNYEDNIKQMGYCFRYGVPFTYYYTGIIKSPITTKKRKKNNNNNNNIFDFLNIHNIYEMEDILFK